MLAHLPVGLARLGHVKEVRKERMDDQDQSDHPNPMARSICGLKWPERQGFLAAIF
jgi:hypothetical protein